ncbi:MAG: elongation factor G [Erysipelotrichaceae bacterium]|nr:elongation factor G [Erysipelotrichaceae bacterium]
MKDYTASEIRNVTLLGHSGSGKSTVVESVLFFTKAIDRMGKASDGNSAMDFDQEEIKRGQSVFTAIAPIEWKNTKINLIDVPGYLDYEGELQEGLAVGDNALIVVSAKDGIESGTEKAFKEVSKRKMPAIFFINKMDEENASFDKVLNELRDKFGNTVIPFEVPIMENGNVVGSVNILRKKAWYYNDAKEPKEVPADMVDEVNTYYDTIAEAIATTDDELMEHFFSGETFTEDQLAKGLRIGVRNGEIKPVYCGSALKGVGIERVLDLIDEYFPSYAEKGVVEAIDEKGELVSLETNEHESFSALVFKTVIDPFVGKISYIKVTSGVLATDAQVYNLKKDQMEKIGQINLIKGKNQIAVGKLFTGDIGCVNKLQYTETNDTLSTKAKAVNIPDIVFPEPMLGVAIAPKTKADEDKMSSALSKIMEEDKSLRLVNNTETHQQVLYALGDQQIDVVISKLKSRYRVEITTEEPKVQYRETITKKVEAEGKHKKQSGGAGQYGHVKIRFEPCDSEEMVFEEEVFGGSVPKQYFPPTEQGLRECMEKGVLAGYKVVGVKAVLYDGSYHEVDSKEIAFKAAARLAYRDGMPKAGPVLLEPIGKAEVTIPNDYAGTINGDFSKRRGTIIDMIPLDDDEQKIVAEVPMSEMMKYATELRSMTQGRGTYTIAFDRYERAPQNVADKVIKAAKAQMEADKED